MFLQWGGIVLLVSSAQLVVTAAVMFWYSWQLTLLVLLAFAPLVLSVRGSSAGWPRRTARCASGSGRCSRPSRRASWGRR